MNSSLGLTRVRRLALAAAAVTLAALSYALIGLARSAPQTAMRMASPYTAKGEPQETPMDWFQEPPYAAALAVCAGAAVWLRRRPDRMPYWVVLGAISAALLWRELPWSERILGANTFSWLKYLGHPEVPLWAQVVFGGGSMIASAALAAYVVIRWRPLVRAVRERLFCSSSLLIVLAGVALVAAQLLDKHRLTDRLLGTDISAWPLKDFAEEGLEIAGAAMLALGTVAALAEEFAAGTSPEPSREPAER